MQFAFSDIKLEMVTPDKPHKWTYLDIFAVAGLGRGERKGAAALWDSFLCLMPQDGQGRQEDPDLCSLLLLSPGSGAGVGSVEVTLFSQAWRVRVLAGWGRPARGFGESKPLPVLSGP